MWEKVRHFLSKKDIYFPPTNELLPIRKSLRPETKEVLDGKGRSVNYCEVVSSTAASLLRVLKEVNTDFNPECGKLTLYLKDGGDGAGTMPALKSKKSVDDAEHMFQYGIIPLRLTQKKENCEEIDVWQNKTPNSAHALRPIFMIREKEDETDLLNTVIPESDQSRNELNRNGINILVDDGTEVSISCVIKDTMKDLKFKTKISGLGGADCLLCKSQFQDWTDPEKAKNGFKIDRTAADTYQIFLSVLDEN